MEEFWIERRHNNCNYKLPYHYEHCYQILFVISGKIQYQVKEKYYEVTKGGVVVLNTLEDHTLKVLEYPYERYIIQINPTFFQQEIRYPELVAVFVKRSSDFSHHLKINNTTWEYLYAICSSMEKEFVERKPYWELCVGADIRRMFTTLYRECSDSFSKLKIGSGASTAYKVLNYLDHHYLEEISVDRIAAVLFLNKHYIAHVFKDETGCSLMEYVISLRMNKAKALLIETDKRISDIALECGYTDFTYFTKQFKKRTGYSPSIFRKRHYEKEQNDVT